jgi:NAD(P)-dependent dehydrogenase (short-subunit alcohol dehydrogenase family)
MTMQNPSDKTSQPPPRAVIVTGGSRGIGAAVAFRLAHGGHPVCVNFHADAGAAGRVVERIERDGGCAFAHCADVADEDQVRALFDTCERRYGSLGGLVNNAGILDAQMPLAEMSVARMRRIVDINLLGALICAREAVRRMQRSRGGQGGAIVNVSSMAARYGAPFEYVDYAASKGAIDTLTVGLAREVAADGIRVNAVRPGLIETQIHASGADPGRVARLRTTIPMQRGGLPDEVAAVIVWLLSDASPYTTGALIDVAGGR